MVGSTAKIATEVAPTRPATELVGAVSAAIRAARSGADRA